MGLAGKLRELRIRASGDMTRRLPDAFYADTERCRLGLEIGGPSALFGAGGILPLYPRLEAVDGVQWATTTFWHELDPSTGYTPEGERTGDLHILDDVNLSGVAAEHYDIVFSSHVIEHIANPLGALAAWRRVSVREGYVLIVAPHMEGTFDRRRALTPLAHMVEDQEQETGEDDLTHVEEAIALHDRRRDIFPFTAAELATQFRDNAKTRFLHHHTFTTLSLGALLGHAGLDVLAAEARLPHDIYMLGRWQSAGGSSDGDSAAILTQAAARSPFAVDRRAAQAPQHVLGPGSGVDRVAASAPSTPPHK
jgi:SAM-dependent methyltransferase